MNLFSFIPFVSFITVLTASCIILFRPRTPFTFRLLGTGGLVLAGIEFCHFMLLTSSQDTDIIFWETWMIRGVLLTGVCGIVFSLIFLRENSLLDLKKRAPLLAAVSGLCAWFFYLTFNTVLFTGLRQLSSGFGLSLSRTGQYLIFFILASLIMVLINLENTFRSFEGRTKKNITAVIKSLCLIFGSYLLLSSLSLMFSYIDTRYTLASSLIIIFSVISGMRAFFRQRVFEVKVNVKRQILYTSATLTIVGTYLIFIGLFTKLFMVLGFNVRTFISFLAAFAVFFGFMAIVFSPVLKQRLRLFVDRSFTRSYDYRREWAHLSEQMGTILDPEKLLAKVKELVKETMNVRSVDIVLGKGNNPVHTDLSPDLIEWLVRYGRPVTVDELSLREPGLLEKNKHIFDSYGAAIINILIVKQQMLGYLSIGPKQDQGEFTEEDKDLLKVISRQVAISVLNANLSQELIVAREMEQFNKFSSFLIHDLKNCVSMLSMIMQNAKDNFTDPKFQKVTHTTLNSTINRMKNLMHKFSSIPEQLELDKTSTDINLLISDLIDTEMGSDHKGVKVFKYLNALPEIKTDKNYIRKVFLNLVLNALEAMPEGGNLVLRSSAQDSVPGFNKRHIQVSISDTGKGMSEEFISKRLFKPFQTSKRKGIGLGLYQCRTIIEAHGGTITAESEKNKGTTFFVRLPL